MGALALVMVSLTQAAVEPGYEERLIAWGLAQHGRTRDPSPEGKVIEEVLLASENVFAPSDVWPTVLNVFHVRTREPVIRREVLLEPGQLYDATKVTETERNLRRLFFIGVARVVAVNGTAGGVALLIITKDRWSLRLANSFTLVGSLLQYLELELVEINFNGWGQQLSLSGVLRLDTLAVGQSFIERRLFGTRGYFGESASLIFNRASGAVEGTTGVVRTGLPLLTLEPGLGVLVDGAWNVRRRRVYRGASVWQLAYPDESGSGGTVPYVYDVRDFTGAATATYSFGREVKVDVSGAIGAWSRSFTPALVEGERGGWLVANYLPRSENVTYVQGYVRAFPANFRVLRNIDTFDLSEDFQLGWSAMAGVRWAVPLPFAPSSFVELGGGARYRLYAADDLFAVQVAGSLRLRPGLESANRRLVAEVKNYSPAFWGGRLVARGLVDLIGNDLDNRQLLVGGSTGLRGAYPDQLSGKSMVLVNVEYRARPIELWSSWLGIVIFSDAASAFTDGPLSFTHTVGIGFRLLLPQFNREVIRIDFGVVFGGANPGLDRLSAGWEQVTDIRPDYLDVPTAVGRGARLIVPNP